MIYIWLLLILLLVFYEPLNVTADDSYNSYETINIFAECSQKGLDSYVFKTENRHENYNEDTSQFPSKEFLTKSHQHNISYVGEAVSLYESDRVMQAFELLTSQSLFIVNQWDKGSFYNPLLESLVWKISEKLFKFTEKLPLASIKTASILRILHIASEVYTVGGHSRVLANFIDFDKHRKHGLFLTQRNNLNLKDIPDFLSHIQPREVCPSNPWKCVERLRKVVINNDLVVLHIHMHDLLPLFAFSAGYNGPPIAFFDHADHEPWVGFSVIDARLVYRKSAYRMYQRRGIEKAHNIMMPLPAQNVKSTRDEARKHFGFKNNEIVLLSMARHVKFNAKLTLLNMILTVLKDNPHVIYVVVSNIFLNDSAVRCAEVNLTKQCMILKHADTYTSSLLHMAADIHIDSFPQTSQTSMVETLIPGGVAVGFCPFEMVEHRLACVEPDDYGSPYEPEKLLAGRPLAVCPTQASYRNILTHLVSSPNLLKMMANDSRASMKIHYGETWANYMTGVYNEVALLAYNHRNSRISFAKEIFQQQTTNTKDLKANNSTLMSANLFNNQLQAEKKLDNYSCLLRNTNHSKLLDNIHIEKAVASRLGNRLFCGTYTQAKYHATKVAMIKQTWAKKCDGWLVFSTVNDSTIPAVNVLHESAEKYHNMWQKVRSIWKYVAMNYMESFDWFLLGGDDMYYIIENLKAYLASESILKARDLQKGLFLGRRFISPKKIQFNSGGAGYILDRFALNVLVKHLDETKCSLHLEDFREEVLTAACLQYFEEQIYPFDTRDEFGRERFHPFQPAYHLTYRIPKHKMLFKKSDWLPKYSVQLKEGLECCSSNSISFHYIDPDLMEQMNNYIYNCPLKKDLRKTV